ncbi:MAG TPA: DUF6531 domain-containing protein [Verrucomicrobiae bacterium]|nr:DUF6531 domain-containing protein [Verrucomicrobiae bacterium]
MKSVILSRIQLVRFLAIFGFFVGSLSICHADGIAWVLDSGSYSVGDGGSVNGNVDLVENTSDSFDQSWPDHHTQADSTCLSITGSGTHAIASTDLVNSSYYGTCTYSINSPINNYSPVPFSIAFVNETSLDFDKTGTISVSSSYPNTPTTATLTYYNTASIMSVAILQGTNNFSGAYAIRGEGNQTNYIHIYRQTGDTLNNRVVNFTVGGNAVSGTDYTGISSGNNSVTIPSGTNAVVIPIKIVQNTNIIGTRILTVTLASGYYQINTNAEVTTLGIIQNVPTFDVNATSWFASPNSNYVGEFTITRTGGLDYSNSITAKLAVGGTAPSGDHTTLPASVTFGTNQTSTNLFLYALNQSLATNETVVLSLITNSTYELGINTDAVVTLIPNSESTNSVTTTPEGRYYRGSGTDPTYWSIVVPLNFETGTVYSNVDGNCSNLYSGLTSWSSAMYYHYNASNSAPQNLPANRIQFNNPIVAFGERVGGTPLYYNQAYQFGIYGGDSTFSNTPIVVQAYYRTNYQLAGTVNIIVPYTTNGWNNYTTNGFQYTTNAYGLTTILTYAEVYQYGAFSPGSCFLTHTASDQATNYYYVVGIEGYPADGSNPMAIDGSGNIQPSLLYSLEFGSRPPWRSTFIDQPHFAGKPLPPFYNGMSLAQMMTNSPPVTNTVSFAPTAATNLDDSPELRRSPILDSFVAGMNNDPIALANFVINQIGLTDPMDYSDNGNVSEESINLGGVTRGALGTFLERQGSPYDQCALLVYLLRQAGVPAVYEFAPRNGLMMLDSRLTQILKFQVVGDLDTTGVPYTTNNMIAVNYPWVAAYIGTNWVHIFPWIKDTQITQGLNLWQEMPPNYTDAYQWIRDYIYGNTNLLSLAVNGDNTPRVIFPAYLQQTLLQNHPGVSVDDIGTQIINRQHYYASWPQFPTPTWVTNVSTSIESLSSSSITNVDPLLTNIFDTVSVEIQSQVDPTKDIKTGDMPLVELENREFYIHQFLTNGNVHLDLILMPFRTNITTVAAFTNDATLLDKEVLSLNFDQFDSTLNINFRYKRHKAITTSDPLLTGFLGFGAVLPDFGADEEIDFSRPLEVGDQAAICMDYGQVSTEMLNADAQSLWQMEQYLRANPTKTNSISPDVYEGELMYLAGMSYYEKCDEFNRFNQQIQSIDKLSEFSAGLSKIIPASDGQGITNTDPVLPCVDMFSFGDAVAGNGTTTPGSGQDYTRDLENYAWLMIADGSAEEHQVINRFYQQTNAVSTVRLLQLAQSSGAGIVPLNQFNYASEGTTNFQGQQLQKWDPYVWQAVVSEFQNSSYVSAYITPGPMTNALYKGMAALILSPYDYEAIISPSSLNGGFGSELFAPATISPVNTPNYNVFNNNASYQADLSAPSSGNATAEPADTTLFNAPQEATYLGNGDYVANSTEIAAYTSFATLDGLPAGTTGADLGSDAQTAAQNGNQGNPSFWSSLYNSVADPVFPITGEFHDDETDLELPGPIPLALRRNYSSQNLADNQFGYGWKLSIMPYLSISKNATNIYAADMDGSVLDYAHQAPAAITAISVNTSGSHYLVGDMLVVTGGTFTAQAQIQVTATNTSGAVTGCTLVSGGQYSTFPTSPAGTTDTTGAGSGAKFNLFEAPIIWRPTLAANPQLNNETTAGVGSLANRLRDYIELSTNGNVSVTNYMLYGADGSVRVFQFMKFDSGTIVNERPYLTQWTDSRGNYYQFSYDTNSADADFGQMTRIKCSNGNYFNFDYDIYGHMVDAYTGDGRRVYYTYDEYGDLTDVTRPDGSTVEYQYQLGTQSVTNSGHVTQYPYSTHLITEEDKPDGRELLNAYDSQRRVTNQWSTAGSDLNPILTASFIYSNNFAFTNAATNRVTGYTYVIDGDGNTNRYDYTNGLITKITDPLNQTIQQIWYPDNATSPGYPRSVEEQIDKRGLITTYLYDSNGNVTNTMFKGDLIGDGIATETATNTAVYNTNCLPVQMTDPAGNSVVTIYDPVFNFLPSQIVHYAGATPISTTLMLYGNATNVVTDGNLLQTNLAFGLNTRTIRAYGSTDAATNDIFYNGGGFPTETVAYTGTGDPNVTNYYFYNERNLIVDETDAVGAVTFFDYDPMNRPTERENIDESGNVLSLVTTYYNENGETNWTDGPQYNPDNYNYFDYDGMGRLATKIHWRSEANSSGTGVEQPSGYNLYAQSFYEYDPLGNLILMVDPRGAMTTNSYNALCELVQSTHLDTDGQTVLSSDSYSYEPGGEVQSHTNALGGVTTTFYNIQGKPEYRINADGSTNGWRYYLDGRISKQIQGNGAYWLTTYDDLDRITTRVFYSPTGAPEATNSVQVDRRGNTIETVDAGFNAFNSIYDGLDRLKFTSGPATTNITETGMTPGDFNYVTNVTAHTIAYFYDAAGRLVTTSNALSQLTVNQFDAIGRPLSTKNYNSTGQLVRESYTGYSPDNNSVTITNGSGANAIARTSWIDTDGHTVLSIGYPSSSTTEFTENQYDLAGNLVLSEHNSSSGGSVTTWTAASSTFDGLNRVTSTTDRDGAVTYFAYDPLNDLTNRTMPGNLQWQASYNSAGQMSQEQVVGGGNAMRTTSYTYYSSGSPFAGLLYSKTDGRGTACSYLYDDWLTETNMTCTGSLPEQNLTTTWRYDSRRNLIGMTEQFGNSGTGPATSIQRSYDPYGELSGESVSDGSFGYGAGQSWGVTGRRSMLTFTGNDYSFGYQADGSMISAGDSTGTGAYTYSTAGILTNRAVGLRTTGVSSLDGEGRPLTVGTTIDGQSLTEYLSYSGDGLLQSNTLYRPDFTDSRIYNYASFSRRLTYEQLNLNNSTTWTNNFAYDNGTPAGPGALTQMGQVNGSSGLWDGGVDGFSRINAETNNTFSYPAYGHVNGQATLTAWLDNNPVSITGMGTNAMQWEATMELSPGSHQLTVAALHPSGRFTALATNYFTNTLAYQQTVDSYDAIGDITNRVWENPSGIVERTQSLSWDARGRLHAITQRDASNSGYNWSAVYDPLSRRISTTTVLVTNGVAYPSSVQTINSYYDPQVEFLELGVSYGTHTEWKLYGPDLSGQYGSMNGVGGLDGISPGLSLFNSTVSDVRGDILGYYDSSVGSVTWNPARPTGYGAVPNYRPVALGSGGTVAQASSWRGRWADITGYYNIGLRPYDPVSGRWLTYDSSWNERDPNYYSFCGGDPINFFDADGRLSSRFYNEAELDTSSFFSATMWEGVGNTYYGIGERLDNGIVQAGAIGSDMIGSSTAGLSDFVLGTDYEQYYQGYSQLYQNIYNNPSSGPTSGQILTGTAKTELNVGTLGLYGMGQGLTTAATTGDYTQLQDASLNALLLSGGVQTMQSGGLNPLSAGYVPNAADQALISYFTGKSASSIQTTAGSQAVTIQLSSSAQQTIANTQNGVLLGTIDPDGTVNLFESSATGSIQGHADLVTQGLVSPNAQGFSLGVQNGQVTFLNPVSTLNPANMNYNLPSSTIGQLQNTFKVPTGATFGN